jgi:hypothetical protein
MRLQAEGGIVGPQEAEGGIVGPQEAAAGAEALDADEGSGSQALPLLQEEGTAGHTEVAEVIDQVSVPCTPPYLPADAWPPS